MKQSRPKTVPVEHHPYHIYIASLSPKERRLISVAVEAANRHAVAQGSALTFGQLTMISCQSALRERDALTIARALGKAMWLDTQPAAGSV